ncbi:MAG: isoquinoline 1-oxidoreductase [Kangiella sp.]|nr:MAG: isoquinoline 1-oxidoreductase [Kangiella sp.]
MKKITRRSFITAGILSSGALIVGVAIRPGNRVPSLKDLVSQDDEMLVNAWVKITPDNRICVIVPHCEMGQGVHTSLPMMLAEELNADWSSVDVLEAPAHAEYANYALGRGFIIGDVKIPKILVQSVNGAFLKITQMLNLQITGGSTAIRTTGIHAMQVAGASAKAMLMDAAADVWQVSKDELKAKNNFVLHEQSKRKLSYAELATVASKMTPPSNPALKDPSEYQIIGTSPQRLDIANKINGMAQFGIDKELPNMVYAAVKSSPVFGGKLLEIDNNTLGENSTKYPDSKIIKLESAVAVISSSYWQATQALESLTIKWSETENDLISSENIFSQFKKSMKDAITNGDAQTDIKVGDGEEQIDQSHQQIEAEYKVPYLAHATMEPLNCTVEIKDGHCAIYTGCQNPLGFRAEVAKAIGFDVENVSVQNHLLGGGFGRRAIADYAIQAAKIALQLDTPVKVIWSREEDTRQDFYRQANISRFKAGINEKGMPTHWVNQYVDKHEPEEAPHSPYDIPNQWVHYTDSVTHIPFGPWRSVDHSHHAFFTESFIDEIANKNSLDPYQFRFELLNKRPRMQNVLKLVAEKSNWSQSLSSGQGRGISIHKSFNTIVAQVAEVEVINQKIKVKKITCVVDAGTAINPDGLIAQMEGGIIYGLTATLFGEITIENGSVQQGNFDSYPILRMSESPEIEVHIIDSGISLGGGGEPGTPPVAAAVANAIYDAVNIRLRSLPLKVI